MGRAVLVAGMQYLSTKKVEGIELEGGLGKRAGNQAISQPGFSAGSARRVVRETVEIKPAAQTGERPNDSLSP